MKRAMFSDLYAFTMGAAYVQERSDGRRVTCEAFTRRLPRNRRFMVSAGLDEIVRFLADWQLDADDIAYLSQVPALRDAMTPEVKERFKGLRFTGDVWAIPDGTVFFPDEPVLRVTAPIIEAQLIETYALSVVNYAASVASKAARVMLASGGKPVVEFGMRRVHPDASLYASKAAYIGGLDATSNVAAGSSYGLPVTGTMAHAFVMVHDSEDDAFRAFTRTYPNKPTLLVDTFDTLEGVRKAVQVAGRSLGAVRLDSGDLAELSKGARAILDAADLHHVKIIVSGDLDENKIVALRKAGAPVDIFAVGTELAVSADAPTLGAVYKVTHDHHSGRGVAKFSASKSTLAGVHQLFRSMDEHGKMKGDVIGMHDEEGAGRATLLRPVMANGKPVGELPKLADSRAHAAAQIAALPDWLRDLDGNTTEKYPVTASQAVREATEKARERLASAT